MSRRVGVAGGCGCNSCTGSCISGCAGTCQGCTGSCTSGCANGCYTACTSSCTGCSGNCTETCTGCSGTCTGSCTGCSGTCTGGCTACTGTCSGTCNNACTSSSASQTIADLGQNITQHGFLSQDDFQDILNAVVNEFSRRGMSTPVYTSFAEIPATTTFLYVAHAQDIFDDLHEFNANNNFTINSTEIVMTSDLATSIAYTQTLMSQNIAR